MTRKQDCFKTILLFLLRDRDGKFCRSLTENRKKISSFYNFIFPLKLLFISAVAVRSAGGESVLPHKVSCAARLAHGVVQTAQRGSEVI